MAPRQLYRDEKALGSLLDNLLQTGQSNGSGPLGVNITESHAEQHITGATIKDEIATANTFLAESKLCSLLPSLENGDNNIREVLASALTAIVRLSKCCKANMKLRSEAEHSVLTAHVEIDRVKKLHEAAQAKTNRLESQNVSLRNAASESDQKNKRVVRKLTTDCTDLKTKCANSNYRVNHLTLEVKKREREYTQLQQRVHSLMTHSKRLSIEPQIVATVANDIGNHPISRGRSLQKEEKAYEESTELSENQFRDEVMSENQAFRDLLRAIQEELDDLLVSNSGAFHEPKRPTSGLTELRQENETIKENGSAKSPNSTNGTDASGSPSENEEDSLSHLRQDSGSRECSPNSHALTTFPEAKSELGSCEEKPEMEEATQPVLPSSNDRENAEPRPPPNAMQSTTESDSCDRTTYEIAKSVTNVESDFEDCKKGTDPGHPESHEDVLSGVTPALTVEQMNLPFEMIRADLEQSLKQKFGRLRDVVLGMSTVG
ncbi:hypothetical protein BWQ96_06961 [Gracilariopsis chorda]|uniref:Uncharacterized protein n=1 Tax=Gracilariopsis chorda TaxID=448386 RepID=A0A2V3IMM4_9FLOR|nr:hypothetical protein BWQ96_06961 [Gracilariopsis chorda]|eukprot:PXF43322.1 hypothetical protein BWQ96_06961 [Gracilariopsis chorda]